MKKSDAINVEFRGIVRGWAFAPHGWLAGMVSRAEALFVGTRQPTEAEQETLQAIKGAIENDEQKS